ncbi:hypothetical protein PHM2_216 [Prochlorococcus phage P-HM2]|uniref:Uncharacterized protein n=1 Tax=Prochlorococcus phage P-HM2 TaxID=445696 RepID=E3ST66_9CAUD|nr:hypothetical protein PHM2_216 [Prochlorococcus phage P-HM2]ADO99994.1 hypothetical protein PHM2_216 [Prochlorococcus phage P-HM2]|tara:strand:+ start:368 stop:604 length:237 start_codon:yes stop_codon:yes gene_type:complete
MNDATVLLYLLCFAVVVGMTFAFMYSMMKSTLREFDKPRPTRPVHPEMEEVQTGDQLLVFRQPEEDDEDDGDAIIIRR